LFLHAFLLLFDLHSFPTRRSSDLWAHQGIPDIPLSVEPFIICDATRAWGHPKARGGWNSHKADLTMYWPTDTVSMAKATYDVLADRKSTRLNSSHQIISYAVFCLK